MNALLKRLRGIEEEEALKWRQERQHADEDEDDENEFELPTVEENGEELPIAAAPSCSSQSNNLSKRSKKVDAISFHPMTFKVFPTQSLV